MIFELGFFYLIKKSEANKQKHGVSFEEAKTVFADEYGRLIADHDHSENEDTIDHFKKMSEETGIPYQNLINLYLRDCAAKNRKLNINWAA